LHENARIALEFFSAIEAGDEGKMRVLAAPGARFTQNTGGPGMSLDTLIKMSAGIHSALPDHHYENHVRSATDTGFVEEHDFVATLPGGRQCRLPAAVIATVVDGRITELHEYIDSAGAAQIREALGG
jgi:ketosteroid isomerase-like protein